MIRTLVVEDDPVAAAAHASYVERVRGFTVAGSAASGADALRALAGTPVDLVLLDVHLPDTSGLEVLRRMRAAGHTTDVIMVTRVRDTSGRPQTEYRWRPGGTTGVGDGGARG